MSAPESNSSSDSLTYRAAGVDIQAGNDFVEAIKPLAKSTARSGLMGSLGGFGGLFDLKAAGFKDPVLVAATDGVGTKLKLAIDQNRFDTIGIDLVAMCVNDLIVQGAEPLFFLDYFATGKLEVAQGAEIVAGVADGCRQSGCALLGGETAEMPGLYKEGDFDLAGFCVGAAERENILDGSEVKTGSVLLGLASNGVHSNGFSLVRKILEREQPTTDLDFLAPTRIYVKSCLEAIKAGGVQALAHITGGGLTENLPRVLPTGVGAEIDCAAWEPSAVFTWLKNAGSVDEAEMLKVFNCGIGMVLVVKPDQAENLTAVLEQAGETVSVIGQLVEGDGVAYSNVSKLFS